MTIQLFDDLDNLLGTFTSIQAAVDAASSGDTIVLGAGTFREQVTIDGAVDLTIRGAGAATIVEMVDAPAANANGGESVFSVLSSTNVIIEDLTVDARGLGSSNAYYGVYYRNSSGEIDNLTVTGVRAPLQNDGTPQGGQIGRAIFAENVDAAPRMLAVTNNTVTDFQKNGIDLRGVGLDVLVDGNVVEGSGFLPAANAIAQNGIVLVNGPTGTISNNEVSEIGFARGDFSTAGILGFNAGDGVVVDNNTILGPRDGQDVLVRSNIGGINFTAGEADSLVITNNTLDGVLNGIILGDNVDTPTVTGNVFLNPVLSLVTNTGQGTLDGANFVVDGDDNDAALNLTGTDGRDEIEGTDFADTLNGGEGGDELDGGDGDDVLDGGAGSDSITGGAGTDVAIIADNEGAPFVDTDFDFSGLTVAGGSVSGTLTGPDGDKTLDGVEVIRVSNTGSSTFVVLDGMSIQDAVNSASAGDTIQIEAGTFTESVTVDKALNFVGAGADQTIIDPASGSGFDLVGDLGTDATVSIDGIGFTDGVAGVDFDDNAILGTLTITNSDFTANTFNGVRIGGNSNPVDLDNVVITDTTFTGNGQPQSSSGDGDILFFQYNGDATITNVTIVGQDRGSGPAENGIQFRGDAGSLGDVTLTNVDISGVYEKQPLAIFNYDDITGLTATDVTITADSTGFELALNFAGVGGDFSLAGIDATGAPDGTALQGDASSQAITGGAADDFLLGSLGNDTLDGGDGADAAGYTGSASDFTVGATVDATSGRVLSFTSVTDNNASDGDEGVDTLSNIETLAFNVGTAMVSTLDLADPVQLLDSNGDLIGTFDTIGAAVTAASAGEAIVVAEGTYDEVVTIDKALSVRGANVGTAGDATRSPESVVAKFVVAADDVDIDGFSVDGTLSAADGTGVAVGAFENVTVQNNVFSDLAERGVDAQGDGTDAGLVIDDNAFDDVGATSQFTNYAIFVDGYAGGSISGNEIDGGLGSGLTLFNADAFQIDGNDFDDTGDEAVNLTNVQNSTFTNNEITDAGPGASFNPVSGMVVFGDLTGTTVSGNAFVLTRPADEETALVLGGAGPTVQGVTVADNTYDGFAAGVVVANVDGSVSVQEDIADFANITQDVDGPTAGPAILVFNGFEGLGVVDEAALSASGTFAKTDTFDADGAPGADDGTAFFANAQDARDASKTGAPITVSGSAGNDSQTGSDGADIINGGAGEDVINGGAGDDTLAGGPGADFINGQQGAGDFADYR
ncbi:MAG: right-handed parallel beta-helix repeat-containing protein, partial [Pseudomonadota bacterium]